MDNKGEKERRKCERFPFREDILIDGTRISTSMDISEGGLYISAIQSYEKNSVIDVTIPFKGKKLTFKAQVRYCQPGIGMGVMFIDLNAEQGGKIKELIESITKKSAQSESEGKNILLVEDSNTTRQAIKSALSKEGFSVSLSIIMLLLSAYFAIPNGNTLVSPERIVRASYLTPPSLKDFHTYKDQSLSAGKFLVASEKISGPRFAKTVILLVNYDYRGAVGLIINRPTETKLLHVFPNVKGIQKATENLYFGGPVAFNQITMIIQSPRKPEASEQVFDDIYISKSPNLLERLIENRKPDQRFRFYSGYAGWGPGQLESEIARNDWIILKSDPDILFDKAPDKIWQRLVPPE